MIRKTKSSFNLEEGVDGLPRASRSHSTIGWEMNTQTCLPIFEESSPKSATPRSTGAPSSGGISRAPHPISSPTTAASSGRNITLTPWMGNLTEQPSTSPMAWEISLKKCRITPHSGSLLPGAWPPIRFPSEK